MDRNDNGDFISLDQHSERFGQVRGGSAGGVSCLGVHAEYITSGKNLFDGADQVDIVGELSCADGSDPGEEPGAAVVSVDIYHVVYLAHLGSHGNKLEVDKRHVVTEEHIGRFQPIHADLFHLILFADKHDL